MGTYRCSDGTRVSQAQIDRRVKKAKAQKLQQFLDKYGYFFCEDCKNNEDKPIDCSHDFPVDKAKKEGRTELAWDVDNITLRGRNCHAKLDKNDVQWTQHSNN